LNGTLLTAYLSVGDYNVIGVDWSELARAPFYNSAATNTRDVGKAAAGLVDFLVNEGTPINYIHLLGFSLGAHAAGWAGASVKVGTLPRITGTLCFFLFFFLQDSRVFLFSFFAVRPLFSLHSNFRLLLVLSTLFSSFDWSHFSFVNPHAQFISICRGHDLCRRSRTLPFFLRLLSSFSLFDFFFLCFVIQHLIQRILDLMGLMLGVD
jgi:hypothetical protein